VGVADEVVLGSKVGVPALAAIELVGLPILESNCRLQLVVAISAVE
jgi:hypothetical protein